MNQTQAPSTADPRALPRVLDYINYREYLRDYYQARKARKDGFTYATFAREAAIRSPNYYKLVMDGQKNLVSGKVLAFARALGLKEHEREYFEALVNANQAKQTLERDYHRERLQRLRKSSEVWETEKRRLTQREFDHLSHWLNHAILVLACFEGFRESPRWIRSRLGNSVQESDCAAALERLLELELLKRGPDGKLRLTHRQLQTEPEIRRQSGKNFYESLLHRAIHELRNGDPSRRELGTYTVGLSRSQLPELRKKVREFMSSLNEWALENQEPDDVYALTFLGIPLSEEES